MTKSFSSKLSIFLVNHGSTNALLKDEPLPLEAEVLRIDMDS
jgi:hypothetical protein